MGYFDHFADELRDVFTYKDQLSDEAEKIRREIDNASCSVAIHARRGDKVQIGGVLEGEYFLNAVKTAAKTIENEDLTFFCFSEDTQWLRETLKELENNFRFIYMDYASDKKGLEDFELMRCCKHQIVADSTYSYWAAYLNPNPDKRVFYSDNGKKGYWPENWIDIKKTESYC